MSKEVRSPEARQLFRELRKRQRSGAELTVDEAQFVKNVRRSRKREKKQRWIERASGVGVNYSVLTKVEKREFRQTWRVDRELARLEKVIGGSGGGDGRTEPPGEPAAEFARDPRTGQLIPLPLEKAAAPLSQELDLAAHLSRVRRSL